MSQQLYFIKLDSAKAKTTLVPLILENGDLSFHDYMRGKEPFYSEEPLSFEVILYKVSSDVALLSIDELNLIVYWFIKKSDYSAINDWREKLCAAGIDIFYEVGSKSQIWAFHCVLSDYEGLSNKLIGYICSSTDIRLFLDYAICYSGMIEILQNDEFNSMILNSEIQKKIKNAAERTGKYIYNLAISGFENDLKTFNEYIASSKDLDKFYEEIKGQTSYSMPNDINEIEGNIIHLAELGEIGYMADGLLQLLGDYKGIVARLHSY